MRCDVMMEQKLYVMASCVQALSLRVESSRKERKSILLENGPFLLVGWSDRLVVWLFLFILSIKRDFSYSSLPYHRVLPPSCENMAVVSKATHGWSPSPSTTWTPSRLLRGSTVLGVHSTYFKPGWCAWCCHSPPKCKNIGIRTLWLFPSSRWL